MKKVLIADVSGGFGRALTLRFLLKPAYRIVGFGRVNNQQ